MSKPVTSPRRTARATSKPATFADMVALLPERLGDWTVQRPDRLCDDRTIYDYMDGAAEVYLTYAFAGLVVRGYRRSSGPPILVELFDMTRSLDAFGVFTNGRDEDQPDAKIGQGAELRPGLLTCWQDRYFIAVRVDTEVPTQATTTAAAKLGRAVVAAVGKTGPLPEVLDALPANGLITHSVRYVNGPDALNYHYDFGDRNLLHLSEKAQAVLAAYRRERSRFYLLAVLYPTAVAATRAKKDFIAEFAQGAGADGAARIEDNLWTAVATNGRLLVVVLDAPARAGAVELAGRAIERYRARHKTPKRKENRP